MPQRAQVEGMNCIQPIAPAELGPRFRPKSVSTLLIAPRTSHGIPYALPAACQMGRRAAKLVGPLAAGANAIGLPAVSCGWATRKVSAPAVPEKASADAARRIGMRRLIA